MSACGGAVCHVHARVQVRVHVGVLACAHVCVCTHCGTLMNGNCCVVRTVVASMSRQKKHCAGLGAPAVSFMHVAGARSDDCLCMWLLVSVRFFEGRAGARAPCVLLVVRCRDVLLCSVQRRFGAAFASRCAKALGHLVTLYPGPVRIVRGVGVVVVVFIGKSVMCVCAPSRPAVSRRSDHVKSAAAPSGLNVFDGRGTRRRMRMMAARRPEK